MTEAVAANPFPGLRPFRTEERELFFGREGQSEAILRRLRQNRLLVLVGPSGSGKSSLINAGLLPHLRGGFLTDAGSHWRIAKCRPQADPIGHLCPVCGSLLEPGGDLGETVGYRVIETRGSMWHSGASGAGQLIADLVSEIIAQRELKHARVRLEIERCDADSVSPQVQPLALAPPHGRRRRETPPLGSHHIRAAATAARHPSFRRRASSSLTVPPEEVRVPLGDKLTHRHEPV